MMDIFKMISDGSKYIAWSHLGKTFDKYIDEDKDEYYLLVPNQDVMDRWSIGRLFQKYHMLELFELSNCYLGSFNEPYMYWHISKRKPEFVKTAVIYDFTHPYRDNESFNGSLRIPDKYTDGYKRYIALIEKWIKNDEMPAGEKHSYEFNLIKYSEFDNSKPYPRFYRKSNNEIRELLRTAQIVPLKELADVVWATAVNGGNDVTRVKSLDPNKAPAYPYIPELQCIDHFISTQKLHKGDIVELGHQFFLVDKESDFDLYAPMGTKVIRARSVCPEYLYLYLNSRTARRITNTYRVPLGDYSSTSLGGSLEEFPVIVPEKEEQFYKEEFHKISAPDKRFYVIPEEESDVETLEQALAVELMEKIKLNSETLVKKQIEEDVNELNICFSNRAYKSTLILAGSIMEALLIDWLSEIRGINYFEETLRKRKYDKINKCYETDKNGCYIYMDKTRADLADYIDEIRDIKRPEWMEEAEEAHKIRDKRNLVHAKLCLKKSAEINEETCNEVITYLKKIIESRWA